MVQVIFYQTYRLGISTARPSAALQFDLSSRAAFRWRARDLGEPRDVSRFLRHDKRALGSHPYSNCTTARPSPAFAMQYGLGEIVLLRGGSAPADPALLEQSLRSFNVQRLGKIVSLPEFAAHLS